MTSGTDKPTTQEAAAEFYMMIGYCVAEWAKVQDELFRICHAALRCPKEQAAIVFYRTPQLDARLTLTDELVRLILPKHTAGAHPHADLKFWNDILKQTRELSSSRNRIAHHPVELRSAAKYWNVSYWNVPPESWFEIYLSENEQLRGRSYLSTSSTVPLAIAAAFRPEVPPNRGLMYVRDQTGVACPIAISSTLLKCPNGIDDALHRNSPLQRPRAFRYPWQQFPLAAYPLHSSARLPCMQLLPALLAFDVWEA